MSCEIIRWSDLDLPRGELLSAVTSAIAQHSGIARAEVCIRESGGCAYAQTDERDSRRIQIGGAPGICGRCRIVSSIGRRRRLNRLCQAMLDGRVHDETSLPVPGASLSLSGATPLVVLRGKDQRPFDVEIDLGPASGSALLIPMSPEPDVTGLLLVRSPDDEPLTDTAARFYESVAQLVGVAIAHSGSRRVLRTRLSELTNLYEIAEVLAWPRARAKDTARLVPELVVRGCPWPGAVAARLVIDGQQDEWWPEPRPDDVELSFPIVVRGRRRGALEVACDHQVHGDGSREDAEHFVGAVSRALGTLLHRWELHDERDELRAQVHHAERLATLGTLASGLAHDLNEPLGAIFGYAELLQKQPELTDGSRDDVAKIVTASRLLRSVVRRLLTVARTSAPCWRTFHLGDVLDDASCVIELSCLRAGVQLTRNLAPDLPDMVGDPEQLCQVVVNLAVNAVHAMTRGGELTLATERRADQLAIIVSDTGTGMSERVMARIFEPFFTTKDRDHGLGLGLAVVHGIVTAHGGTVSVESEVGRGTRVTVLLPRTPPANVEAPLGND
ncbi:MAG: hypothetical protein HYV09_12210 [Deltaproteobacteria bacterium]|nr:hypothetical protein [Deltaproteobacteria bacterium]